ncbi:MAG: hypothetical protein K5898_11795 [Ruminococcus sp.]|uniref:hypothetical protein n=1 Tax=Ruminococcus sp. TaxID=41978 RepID=UPI0025D40B0B|nr:hypothetical protein [Ruminococcus sp.]MCR4795821.1 hypothetical protein [Ruminococcus sp.]
MNRKTLLELALPNKSIVSDNSCYINEQKKKQICEALKIANFSQHIIAFINEFAGISVMVSIATHLFQSFDVILPRTATVNTCELLEIGRVEKEWAVANCGEVWSAREAILNGAKFDELTFQSINASN